MFDKDFIFGAATASFQIEGATNIDGRTPSIWDTHCQKEGNIYDSSNGDIACESYLRYKEDVKLLKKLGVKAYRFSISWSRVMPKFNKVNKKGINYYRNLALELIKNGITPYVTIYHWDMPQYIDDMGGFLNPDFPKWFEEYTNVVTTHLGDIVKDYITINEPQCII
ncbi:MAG: family 1 glycosylhydrolase, partial [Acholeplasmatales bacterium]|nr:family 1 glycosylhydrolase [Acholeplasmatales bacterium]